MYENSKLGICDYYDAARNFGFLSVKNDDGSVTKYFVHRSELNGIGKLKPGDIVRFNVGTIPPGRTSALALQVVLNKIAPVTPAVPAAEKSSNTGVK
jgi:cold shock CspA family protein